METDAHCVWPGCKAPARSCHPICGRIYCRQHYDSALREHFLVLSARNGTTQMELSSEDE